MRLATEQAIPAAQDAQLTTGDSTKSRLAILQGNRPAIPRNLQSRILVRDRSACKARMRSHKRSAANSFPTDRRSRLFRRVGLSRGPAQPNSSLYPIADMQFLHDGGHVMLNSLFTDA